MNITKDDRRILALNIVARSHHERLRPPALAARLGVTVRQVQLGMDADGRLAVSAIHKLAGYCKLVWAGDRFMDAAEYMALPIDARAA